MIAKTPSTPLETALKDMRKIQDAGKETELINSNAFKDFQTELALCMQDNEISHSDT